MPATTTPPEPPAPRLGRDGECCSQCSAPLSVDQRYCLSCGFRRAPMRLPFADIVQEPPPQPQSQPQATQAPPAPVAVAARDERSSLPALGSLLALLLALGIGVLIGSDDDAPTRTPVVTLAGAPPAAAAGAADSATNAGLEVWPEGTDGYTIVLVELPGSAPAADIERAAEVATGEGASAVGSLKSDDYASLEPGQTLVFSGTFTTKAEATRAREDLPPAYADSDVVRVASAADGNAKTSSERAPKPAEPAREPSAPRATPGYGKSTNKIPDKIETEGAPPPVDNKAPGGGSDEEATEIG